ncbi:MAG: hypothetical protein HYY93_09425 [Planctomycetes bacterium]|nr:hypothetical protein [Planctomycetota bacterium]
MVRRQALRSLAQSQGDLTYPNRNYPGFEIDPIAEFSQVTSRLLEASNEDPDPKARAAAAQSLTFSSMPTVVRHLIEIASDRGRSTDERTAALGVVDQNRDDPRIDSLLRNLMNGGENFVMRRYAMQIFTHLPSTPARVDFISEIARRDSDLGARIDATEYALKMSPDNVQRVEMLTGFLAGARAQELEILRRHVWSERTLSERLPRYEEAIRLMAELRDRYPKPQ